MKMYERFRNLKAIPISSNKLCYLTVLLHIELNVHLQYVDGNTVTDILLSPEIHL